MFELPEVLILARQINDTLQGKIVRRGQLGSSPHKFVWYNRTHTEFEALTAGKNVGNASARGKWLFIPLEPGYVLLLGEFGGKMLYHAPGSGMPGKYHLCLEFADGSLLTVMTRLWGAIELHEGGSQHEREYIQGMCVTPVDEAFTYDYFCNLIELTSQEKKRSLKSLLTQDQLIPGLGNAIAQDIQFRARLHPRRSIDELCADQSRSLYAAVVETVAEVVRQGGRYDEVDLFGKPGGYVRLMDRNTLGQPCPECGCPIQKTQYLGGACYFCPDCQKE